MPVAQTPWQVMQGATHIATEHAIRGVQAEADGRVDHLLLLVSDTRHNRTALAEAGAALTATFPLGTRAVLSRLARGEAPQANGVAIL